MPIFFFILLCSLRSLSHPSLINPISENQPLSTDSLLSFRDYSIIGVFIETAYFIGDSGKINFPGSQGAGMAGNNDNALLDSDKKQCGGKVWNLNAGCGLVGVFLNQIGRAHV